MSLRFEISSCILFFEFQVSINIGVLYSLDKKIIKSIYGFEQSNFFQYPGNKITNVEDNCQPTLLFSYTPLML